MTAVVKEFCIGTVSSLQCSSHDGQSGSLHSTRTTVPPTRNFSSENTIRLPTLSTRFTGASEDQEIFSRNLTLDRPCNCTIFAWNISSKIVPNIFVCIVDRPDLWRSVSPITQYAPSLVKMRGWTAQLTVSNLGKDPFTLHAENFSLSFSLSGSEPIRVPPTT